MKRFKSPRQAQRFLSTHDQVANVFPAPEITTLPQVSGPTAPRPSPPGPTSPASRWLHNHASLSPSARRAFHQSADPKLTVPGQCPVRQHRLDLRRQPIAPRLGALDRRDVVLEHDVMHCLREVEPRQPTAMQLGPSGPPIMRLRAASTPLGIVTETGPGVIGGSGKMLACLCSATGAIASPPRSSSTRSGSICALP